MALSTKVNGQAFKLVEASEVPAVHLEKAAKKMRVIMHNDAAQDTSFVDLIVNTVQDNDGIGYYVLSLMGPKSPYSMVFGYRNGAGVFAQIWAIPKS